MTARCRIGLIIMLNIDRLDTEILARLDTNARMGVAELSSQLGVARNTVLSRLRRLEEKGVITGYAAQLDLDAAGIPVRAFVGVELDQRQLSDVVAALTKIPQVLEINIQAGREDLLVQVAAPTHAGLQEAVTTMINIDGVRHTTTTLIVSTPLTKRTQSLLAHLTSDAGFGRSTPSPL